MLAQYTDKQGLNTYKFSEIEKMDTMITTNMFDILYNIRNTLRDNSTANITKQTDELAIIVQNLAVAKLNFIDEYREIYYDTKDYNKQLIFDYKIKYIDDYLTKYNETILPLLKSTQVGSKETELTKIIGDYRNERSQYIDKYDALIQISSDIFKTNIDKLKNRDNDNDNESKIIQDMASNTSSNIYVLLICYIVLIIMANIVK